jgi:hypothetical protein
MIIILSETEEEDYKVEEVFEYGPASMSWYLTDDEVSREEIRHIKKDLKTW